MRAGELTSDGATRQLAAGVEPVALARRRAPRGRLRGAWPQRTLVPALLAFDLLAVLAAYALAFAVRIRFPLPLTSALLEPDAAWQPHAALLLLLATQAPLLYVFGLYDVRLLRDRVSPWLAPAAAVAAQLLLVSAWYFFRGEIAFPRSVLLLFSAANLLLLGASRVAARRVLRHLCDPVRVALVGPPREVEELHAQIEPDAERHGITVIGAVRAGPAAAAAGDGVPCWLGAASDLGRLAREHAIEQLIVVPGGTGRDELLETVLRATSGDDPPRVALVPSVYELRVGRLASLRIDDVPLIEVVRDPSREPAFRVKALLDGVLATALLTLALPVWLVAAVAIRLSSPGPVLYRQRRVGRGGREFIVYKLRTMRDDAEHASGPVLASDGDERVTGPGRFLRATRIDEIPQLLNVLNGTMSLIGPRPERPEFAERLAEEIPGYRERWLVKPGLSGLAQVHGEYHTSPEYKLKYDLAYIHNYTLLLDLRIMAETVKTLFTRRGV
ncbi:MAG: exopolysaccharide biosynthesis polyprenyl glycosylphosphotransferase [Thermodesulfobacteriota bacterium]